MGTDSRLGGRVRSRVNAAVRARTDHPVCPLCGYPIDRNLPRTGKPHPLSSVIDEWLPRTLGGNPHDEANCVELHRLCNGIKGKTWPVTPNLRARCTQRIAEHLNTVTINPW